MKFIASILAAVASASGYDDEYEHTHTEYGEDIRYRDVVVYYDEIEYNINTKTDDVGTVSIRRGRRSK